MAEFAHTHARQDDPDTSHQAARKAQGVAAAHKAKILAQLRRGIPMTGHEIARAIGLDAHRVMKRTADLARDGEIEDSGARRQTPSGRMAIVWQVVPKQGRLAL